MFSGIKSRFSEKSKETDEVNWLDRSECLHSYTDMRLFDVISSLCYYDAAAIVDRLNKTR